MTFISYAQNFEDVMLMRALSRVKIGRYIDVGAAEPVADSVTAAFYKLGWRGINVEPMNGPFSRLQEARPLDINLQLALEEKQGAAQYFSVDGGNGISTGVAEFGEGYKDSNWDVNLVSVVVSTLTDVCERYVGEDTVHFLKIDVEGKERAVLQGADFSRYRPWIILVEATRPNSEIQSYDEWEYILEENNYRFVYFDGLNRFYLADEKFDSLKDSFKVPPNWFDNFMKASEFEAKATVDAERKQVATLLSSIHELEGVAAEAGRSRDEAFAAWKLEKAAREDGEARLHDTRLELERHIAQGELMLQDEKKRPELEIAQDLEVSNPALIPTAGTAVALEIAALRAELDAYYQESFESSRLIAWLTQERFRLSQVIGLTEQREAEQVRQVHELNRKNHELYLLVNAERARREEEISAIHRSSSWRVTGPLRRLGSTFKTKK